MTTNFPTSLDSLTNPTSGDTLDSPDHAGQHANANDAIEALQAKVGANSSAVTASHDYKIAQLEANNSVTDARLRDSAALSVIGRSANSTGDPADIAAATDGHVLRRAGTALGFGQIVAAGITDGTITGAKIATNTVTGDKLALATNARTASYTLVLADSGKLVEMGVASANNLTVPLNSSQAFPVGTQIHILQTGAGQTTIVPTSGVTINSEGAKLKLKGQWAAATLVKRATDTWVVFGNLSA